MIRMYGHSTEYMGDKTVYIINFILYLLDTARITKYSNKSINEP